MTDDVDDTRVCVRVRVEWHGGVRAAARRVARHKK
jgi:hypothetical protein